MDSGLPFVASGMTKQINDTGFRDNKKSSRNGAFFNLLRVSWFEFVFRNPYRPYQAWKAQEFLAQAYLQ
jgi:hypothetical protein